MECSFSAVMQKVFESQFFLGKLEERNPDHFFELPFYLSAFLSASRSITFAMQSNLSSIPGFDKWYEQAQAKMANNELAIFFRDARNNSEKQAYGYINTSIISGGEIDFFYGNHDSKHKFAPSGSMINACHEHFCFMLQLMLDLYIDFGDHFNPEIYFSEESTRTRGLIPENEIYKKWGYPKMGLHEDDSIEGYLCAINHPRQFEKLLATYLKKNLKGELIEQ